MIFFDQIIIEGFGSIIDEIKYPLNKKGINLIVGLNGAGKTTFFSALTWVIYGQPLKNIKAIQPWPSIAGNSYRGTKGQVDFKKGGKVYSIIRCLGYKDEVHGAKGKDRLILVEDGIVSGIRDKREIQNKINEILGYSFKLFKHSILFGQNLARIIEEKGPDKKAIFDEACELSFINAAKKNTQKVKSDLNTQLSKSTPKYLTLKNEFNAIKERKKRELALKNNWDKEKAEKLSELNNKLQTVVDLLAKSKSAVKEVKLKRIELNESKKEYLKLRDKLSEYHKADNLKFKSQLLLTEQEGDLQDIQVKIDKLIESFSKPIKKCSRCGQDLDKDKVKQEKENIKSELEILKKDRKKVQVRIEAIKVEINGYQDIISSNKEYKEKEISFLHKHNILEREIQTLESQISNRDKYKEDLEEYRKQFNELENKKPDFEDELDRLKKRLSDIKKSILPLKKERKAIKREMDIADWLINDPLSNQGLKAYIFSNMLETVNKYLKVYGNEIGYKINFIIDLESANKNFEVIIKMGSQEVFYEELSGGQQQLVDVCIAFAIHDTTNATKACNLLIMDEVFESLSSDNIEKVIDLIKIKAKELSLHLITHRTEFNLRTSKVTYLKLKKGVTKII